MKQLKLNHQYSLALILSVVILCFWGFVNGFPMTFNDTAAYLGAAFSERALDERPILYGLFMRWVSLETSLWLVVIVQACLVSYLIFLYFVYVFEVSYSLVFHVGYVLLISLCMGASFVVCWLMPDVFTPIAVLCMGYLLFGNHKVKFHTLATSVLFVVAVAMHFSHSVICLLMLVVLFLSGLIRRYRTVFLSVGLSLKRLGWVFALVGVGVVFSSSVQSYFSGNLKSRQSGVFFLMGNLVEMGIVDHYLNETCATKNYKMCQYKDSLSNNFIWASNSPHNLSGGWAGYQEEYTEIVKDILTTPKYFIQVVYKSFFLAFKQFLHFDMCEANKPSPKVEKSMCFFFPDSYEAFVASRQYNERYESTLPNFLQILLFGCCLLFYVFELVYKRMPVRLRVFMFFVVLSLVVNACVCGAFSGVFPRYQDRLVWLLPLPIVVFAIQSTKNSSKTIFA